MTLSEPIWLLMLLPVALVAVWVSSRSAGTPTEVPFVDLWTVSRTPRGAGAVRRLPPVWILLALASVIAATFAAAGPYRVGNGSISLIVDDGRFASADGRDASGRVGQARFRLGVDALAQELSRRGANDLRIHLRTVHAQRDVPITTQSLSDAARPLEPSALVTDLPRIDRAIAEARRERPTFPIVLISDAAPVSDSDDMTFIAPLAVPGDDLGIEAISAVGVNTPDGAVEVMVRVSNTSATALSARLRVVGESGAAGESLLELPARGQTDAFVSLTAPGRWLEARIVQPSTGIRDAMSLNDAAWLALEAPWASVEAVGDVPASVARLLVVYRGHRPPTEFSPRVLVMRASSAEQNRSTDRVILPAVASRSKTPGDASTVATTAPWARPIAEALSGGRIDQLEVFPPPGDESWRAVVTLDGAPVVAERTNAAGRRDVWLGAGGEAFAGTPAFVVVVSAVLDSFAGGAAGTWRASDVSYEQEGDAPLVVIGAWRPSPGVYTSKDGRITARNAIGVVRAPEAAPGMGFDRLLRAAACADDPTAPATWARRLLLLAGALLAGSVGALRWDR